MVAYSLILFLVLSLLYCGDCGYIVYRAYWSPSNYYSSSCYGQPDNVGVITYSNSYYEYCSDYYSYRSLPTCTYSSYGHYYKDVCINSDTTYNVGDSSLRPPYDGTWVEVREMYGTISYCQSASISQTYRLVGWFKNGVCSRSSFYPSYNSRVYFNSSSAEVRMNCNVDMCETTCSYSNYVYTSYGSSMACISTLLIRPVTGYYIAPSPTSSSPNSYYYDYYGYYIRNVVVPSVVVPVGSVIICCVVCSTIGIITTIICCVRGRKRKAIAILSQPTTPALVNTLELQVQEEPLQQFIQRCIQLLQQQNKMSCEECEVMKTQVMQSLHKELIFAKKTLQMMTQQDFFRVNIPMELISIIVSQLQTN